MSRLLDHTLRLLQDRPHHQTIPVIAKALDFPPFWLRDLNNGKIKEPSVYRVEKLYEYLSGKKLDI